MSKTHTITPPEEQVPALAKWDEFYYEDIDEHRVREAHLRNGCVIYNAPTWGTRSYEIPYQVGDTLLFKEACQLCEGKGSITVQPVDIDDWAVEQEDCICCDGEGDIKYEVTSVDVGQIDGAWKFKYGINKL